MADSMTKTHILAEATKTITAFSQTQAFENNGVSFSVAGRWLFDLTEQMFDQWGQEPSQWTFEKLQPMLSWMMPQWRFDINSSDFQSCFNVVADYIGFLSYQRDDALPFDLIKSVEGLAADLIADPEDPTSEAELLFAQARLFDGGESFEALAEWTEYQQTHLPELMLMADGLPFSTLQTIVDQFASTPISLKEFLWQDLQVLSPKMTRKVFDQALIAPDFQLSGMNRVLLAADLMNTPIRNQAVLTRNLALFQKYLMPAREWSEIQTTLQAALRHEQSLPLEAEGLPVQRIGGFNVLNQHFQYGHKQYLPIAAVDLAIDATKGKPDVVQVQLQALCKDDPEIQQATEYALTHHFLIPSLAGEQVDLDDFLKGIRRQDWLTKMESQLSYNDVDHLLSDFYNELFLQTGRLPKRWTKSALRQVLQQGHWQHYSPREWVDVANVLDSYVMWLDDDGEIKNGETLSRAITQVFDAAQGEPDDARKLTDKLLRRVAKVTGEPWPPANEDAFIQRQVVALYLMADHWPMQQLAWILAPRETFDTNDHKKAYLMSWFNQFVVPTYTLAQAAALTGESMLLRAQRLWEVLFYQEINRDTPVPLNKRAQIAVQVALGGSRKLPTKAQLHRFYADHQRELTAIKVDYAQLEQLVPTQVGRTLSSKKWHKRKPK